MVVYISAYRSADTAICLKTKFISSFINTLSSTLTFQILSHDAKWEANEEFIDCFEYAPLPLQELTAESRSDVGGTCVHMYHDIILYLNDKISNSFDKGINK